MERNNRLRKKDGETTADVVAEEDEVFTSEYAPREAETVTDRFRKRSSLARTPSLRRTISLPSEGMTEDRDKGRGEDKRKRSEDSPPETAKKPREASAPTGGMGTGDRREKLLSKVAGIIEKLHKDVEELFSITTGSRNTKVEIKELAEDLSILIKELTSVDFRGLGEREEDGKPRTREMATQTEQRKRLRSRRKDSTAAMTTLGVWLG